MKIIPFLGDLSGKLGGIVASRNRGGAYLKSFVKPTNPNSIAQQRARSSFGTAANSYHALSAPLKAAWQNFAATVFISKSGNPPGNMSGFNAFVSLKNGVGNGQTINQAYNFEVNGAPVVPPVAFLGYSALSIPPNFTLEASLKVAGTGEAAALSLASVTVTSLGIFDLVLNVAHGPVGPQDIDSMVDPNDNPMGFAVYMSNGSPQAGMATQNPEKYCLGFLSQSDAAAAALLALDTIEMDNTTAIDIADYSGFPGVGEHVDVTVYAVSLGGMFKKIGTLSTQLL